MERFISDVSQKEFPQTDKVSGHVVRQPILELIQKDHPDFTDEHCLSLTELNYYREKYISGFLVKELDELSELKNNVLDALRNETKRTGDSAAVKVDIGTEARKILY